MNASTTKLLICWLVAVALGSCQSHDNTKEDYTNLFNSPPYASLTDSIKRDPKNVQLIMERALRLSQANLHKAATGDYEKAWKISGDENIAFEYASNLLLASQVTKAINVLEEANKKFPDNTEFSRRLAEIYLQNGQNRKAIDQYNTILARDPGNFEAWFDKGNLLLKLEDTAGAVEALERSFAILPINYSGMALARIYVERKNPRALQICNILLSGDTAGVQTDPVYMKGVYYSEVKDDGNALKEFEECIRRDWKMTEAYIEKGIIFFERKDYDTALKTFSMAATVSNTDADAYYWMGRCYEATGKKADAITNYRRALALDTEFSEAKAALRRLNG
jgi:tetratricopeptide (TPR) repeat protein